MTKSSIKWALSISTVVVFLALLPQIDLWAKRGSDWHGAYAIVDGDEFLYSAYVNALIDGRSRRNDPFAGRDDHPKAPMPESTFSIQVLPPLVITSLARIIGVPASSAFIVLIAAAAFLSSLTIFWFFRTTGANNPIAAVGTLFLLCFGTAAAGEGLIRLLIRGDIETMGLPFLRRYQPSAAFFLFFVFCSLVYRALRTQDSRARRGYSVLASMALGMLVFSYLYLWTAAAAWLCCIAILWMFKGAADRRKAIEVLTIIGIMLLCIFPFYIYLVLHRAGNLDETQTMISTRQIDIFRTPELVAALIMGVTLLVARRSFLRIGSPSVLFSISLCLLPFILFNQQLITGKSMQPFHYEYFIANYGVLAAVVLLVSSFNKQPSSRLLLWIAALSVLWGLAEVDLSLRGRGESNIKDDQMVPVLRRLRDLTSQDGTFEQLREKGQSETTVFSPHLELMSLLPTWAPQGVLPGLGSLDFGSGTKQEPRVLTYLYYCGVNPVDLRSLLEGKSEDVLLSNYARVAVFGHERVVPTLTFHAQPIKDEEIEGAVHKYANYIASFSREEAQKRSLAYIVVRSETGFDFSHIDSWYERDVGEHIQGYDLYRLRLRGP